MTKRQKKIQSFQSGERERKNLVKIEEDLIRGTLGGKYSTENIILPNAMVSFLYYLSY